MRMRTGRQMRGGVRQMVLRKAVGLWNQGSLQMCPPLLMSMRSDR